MLRPQISTASQIAIEAAATTPRRAPRRRARWKARRWRRAGAAKPASPGRTGWRRRDAPGRRRRAQQQYAGGDRKRERVPHPRQGQAQERIGGQREWPSPSACRSVARIIPNTVAAASMWARVCGRVEPDSDPRTVRPSADPESAASASSYRRLKGAREWKAVFYLEPIGVEADHDALPSADHGLRVARSRPRRNPSSCACLRR